jgi:uncharacterized membrane protein
MSTTLGILSIWLLAAAGIQLGTLWIMKLSILPMLNSLPYDRYVNTCQLIDMHIFHPIALGSGVFAAVLGLVTAGVSGSPALITLYVLGSVGMLIVGLTSEGVNRPIWRQIEKWNPARVVDDWPAKRYRWHLAHQVRTYAAIAAVAFYGAAFVILAV